MGARNGRRSDAASLCLDDNGAENSADLVAFIPKALDFGLRFQFQRGTDTQPIAAFSHLSEGDVEIANELPR